MSLTACHSPIVIPKRNITLKNSFDIRTKKDSLAVTPSGHISTHHQKTIRPTEVLSVP